MTGKTIVQLLGFLCVAGLLVEAQMPTCSSSQSCPGNMMCTMASYCQMGTCGCPSSMKAYNASLCVMPTVMVGGNCMSPSQCMGALTTCNGSNMCACSVPGYMAKSDNTDCMAPTMMTLGSSCSASAIPMQCGLWATCVSSVCQCSAGYVANSNNIDCRMVMTGDTCSNTTTCPPSSSAMPCTNGNCNSGMYQCNMGYTWMTSNAVSGCLLSNVTTNVGVGHTCSNSPSYMLCSSGLSCLSCPESSSTYTCQKVATTTTPNPGGKSGAPSVRFDIVVLVTLVAMLRLA